MADYVRQHLLRYSTLTLAATLVAGCSGTSYDQASASGRRDPQESTDNVAQNEPSAGDTQLDLRGVDYEGLLEFIESHKGHPIVLDIWNTSCAPCIRELPNLAKLQEDYEEQGVVCASFNIDFTGAAGTKPGDARERAREVLEALDVHVHHLYSTVPDGKLYKTELFKRSQVYAVPAILVFDRMGVVVGNYGDSSDGASPYSELRQRMETLLKDD